MDSGTSPEDLDDGDRLFGQGGPWQFNTKMSWDSLGDYRYIEGFRTAAEALGDRVAEDRGLVDVLAMPILFCYRQWMELRLKDLQLQGATLDRQDVEARHGHDLADLWRRARPVLERTWPNGDREELDRLATVINELAGFDGPTGTGFRYARDRQGRRVAHVTRIAAERSDRIDGVLGRFGSGLTGH